MSSPLLALNSFFDAASTWLSALPANPVTEFLQGALLLVRRTFFNFSTNGSKPGLISSDWLTVVKETGEWDGDEPVMVTVVLTTTLGVEGSTTVKQVDRFPNQFGSGVDAGQRIRIPDADGDAWLDHQKGFTPLSSQDISAAVLSGKPVPIPVVVTVTMMLEGDFSDSNSIGLDINDPIEGRLLLVGKELEATKLVVDFADVKNLRKVLGEAQKRIEEAVNPGMTQTLIEVALRRIRQWVSAGGDPDDPIGVSVSALIPVDSTFLPEGLPDPRQFCFAKDCKVASVEVTSPGSGYDINNPPTVTLVGGGGEGATVRVVINDRDDEQAGYVTTVEITNPGKGYYSAPTVVFDGGGSYGGGAEARAVIAGNFLDDQYLGVVNFPFRNAFWDSDIQIRYGFLVPAVALSNKQPQQWTTTYAGDYVDNDWAEYKVETQAWPMVSW